MNQINQFISAGAFQNAAGSIPFNMTNDYMFRAVLQTNNKALRGLICSLLHLSEDQISSVRITNPIILGESIKSKEFRLDVNVILNDNTFINLEMQVLNKLNWPNRSISCLCRSFDHLYRGQDYSETRPVIHIGFLDYTLFKDYPEFYATHKLMNVKNHHIYSDNFTLIVIDLSQIKLATLEDTAYLIDKWAALFKSATWEEIKMIASENESLKEASETLFRLSADEQIQKQCRDREEFYQDLRSYEKALAQREATLEQKDMEIAQKDAEISQKDAEISQKDAEIAALKAQLAQKTGKQ